MEVRNFKRIDKGVLVARFDLVIPKWGDFIIHGCSWCKKDGGGEWISFPTYCLDTPEGKKYLSHCRFLERDKQNAFNEQVLPLVRKMAQASQTEPSESNDQDDLPF